MAAAVANTNGALPCVVMNVRSIRRVQINSIDFLLYGNGAILGVNGVVTEFGFVGVCAVIQAIDAGLCNITNGEVSMNRLADVDGM